LLNNGYPHFAVLSNAIDGEDKAYEWLIKNNFSFLVVLADACRGKEKAVKWLKENKLEAMIKLSENINEIIEKQRRDYYDPHKMKFNRY
jgi:hypothetical protein